MKIPLFSLMEILPRMKRKNMMFDNFHWGIEWEYINEIPTLKSQQSIRCLNSKFY